MVVDLRSDTLTMPGPEMREAMARAPIGDDVYGEDPSIRALEERAAELTGKAAAVFVASGTMGNLLGVLALARSGQEIIADASSHVFLYEGGGAAALGGIQIRPVTSEGGVMATADVEAAIRPTDDYHQPLTRAVCVENTHNRAGGVCWPLEDLRALREMADRHGLALHMDGARVFNAAIAQGVPVSAIAGYCDTVTFCVSKGLGAPVGSVLCGSADAIDTARRWRKMVGGGWREAGSLAAAGSFALERMVERLHDDHRNARTLAEGLAELPGIEIDLGRVQTNLVSFALRERPVEEFLDACAQEGVLGGGAGRGRVRFVTHYGIEPPD
ncbi:MAG: low-specificity L-threonine aldolase, partial [Candidatus Dormibacteraceae bacterium]